MTVITGFIDASAKASIAMALSAGIVVAASAAPARADSVGDDFLATLTRSGAGDLTPWSPEVRDRARLRDAVEHDVDLFVEEGDQARDR